MAVDSLAGRIGGVSYLHIPARDVAASAAFYRDVFGWQLHGQPDDPGFSDGTGHVIGRWVTDQAATGTDRLRAYVYVTDVDDTLAAVTAHGGQVVTPPYPEGTLRVALFADLAGNVLGIWQETAAAKGHADQHPAPTLGRPRPPKRSRAEPLRHTETDILSRPTMATLPCASCDESAIAFAAVPHMVAAAARTPS